MKIEIDTIPHDKQRYRTLGDWYYQLDPASRAEKLVIKVSETGDWRSNALIAMHELVEVLLCKQAGVSQEAVDKFDEAYEVARRVHAATGSGAQVFDEPGDDPTAPYHQQHYIAMQVEKYLCEALAMHWDEHEKRLEEVDK